MYGLTGSHAAGCTVVVMVDCAGCAAAAVARTAAIGAKIDFIIRIILLCG